jgi:hypothetical protein
VIEAGAQVDPPSTARLLEDWRSDRVGKFREGVLGFSDGECISGEHGGL